MVTDQQIRRLKMVMNQGRTLGESAAKAGMSEKTARKYMNDTRLPSEQKLAHEWRTRKNPFLDDWMEVAEKLQVNPGLEAKTLFDYIQWRNPGKYQDNQLRTLQRHIKIWRALEGPAKEVYFSQIHIPGQLSQSDFTSMNDLMIMIKGEHFKHLYYHFVLTYSNWETGSLCFSESFESLSEGLQNALFELGGVPKEHQTDRLSAAVNNMSKLEEFTKRYDALLNHYGLQGRKIQTGKANENGDVEQRHNRFKRAVKQSLLLKGSNDFNDQGEYVEFIRKLFKQLNIGRKEKFKEEVKTLKALPMKPIESSREIRVKVGCGSTIRVNRNTYSVNSNLIGETVKVILHGHYLEVLYGNKCIETIARMRGGDKHNIQYRHIIDWLVRKPGAFENYKYRDSLFPTHRFRIAYDSLKEKYGIKGNKEYLGILYIAAKENETAVDDALGYLIKNDMDINLEAVKALIEYGQELLIPTDVEIEEVNINVYDCLLEGV